MKKVGNALSVEIKINFSIVKFVAEKSQMNCNLIVGFVLNVVKVILAIFAPPVVQQDRHSRQRYGYAKTVARKIMANSVQVVAGKDKIIIWGTQ